MTSDAFRDTWREASREQWAAWRSITDPSAPKGPEPVSGDFCVTLDELELSGEDPVIDFRRFVEDTAQRARPGGPMARGGDPVTDFFGAVAACLRSGGPVSIRPTGMTFDQMQRTTHILRAAAERAAIHDSPRHVRLAARRLSVAWQAFSGTTADPRSPREKRLAWGDQRGWIEA